MVDLLRAGIPGVPIFASIGNHGELTSVMYDNVIRTWVQGQGHPLKIQCNRAFLQYYKKIYDFYTMEPYPYHFIWCFRTVSNQPLLHGNGGFPEF